MRLSREFKVKKVEDRDITTADSGAVWIGSAPTFGDIDIDNDGVISGGGYEFLIDLSEATSQILGRQASMMASYKVHSISIGIRPVDDVVDNDESAFFAGRYLFFPYTEHGEKMMKLARSVEKANEDQDIDSDSWLLSTDKDYRGMRFGWNGDNQVAYQTAESISGYGGSEWDLANLKVVYNLQTAPNQSNALFNGRAPSWMSHSWIAALASGMGTGDSPPYGGSSADDTCILNTEILGGLIKGNITYSSSDEDGVVDDDYIVMVSVVWTPEVKKW